MINEIDSGLKELIHKLNSFFKIKRLKISTIFSCEGHIINIIDNKKLLSENPNMYIMFEGVDCYIIQQKIAKEFIKIEKKIKLKNLMVQNENYENRLILGFYLSGIENDIETIIKFNKLKYEFQNVFWEYMEKELKC